MTEREILDILASVFAILSGGMLVVVVIGFVGAHIERWWG